MKKKVTMSLDEDIVRELDEASKRSRIAKSVLVEIALKNQLPLVKEMPLRFPDTDRDD